MSLKWLRIIWFFKQVWVLWQLKSYLGLDGKWPTILLKPHSKGDLVHDDLTLTRTTVLGVEYAEGYTDPNAQYNHIGCWGIYVDSSLLNGARHPWEVSSLN